MSGPISNVFVIVARDDDEIDYGCGVSDAAFKKIGDVRPVDEIYTKPEALTLIGPSWRPNSNGLKVISWGVKVEAENLPQKYYWKGPKRPIPDYQRMYGMALVSARFKDLVEKLEPQVHQFVPISVIEDGNAETADNYFWFIVGQFIDSVESQKSSMPTRKKIYAKSVDLEYLASWEIPYPLPEEFKLVFDKKKIGSSHIWVDPFLLEKRPRCSDVFMASCEEANLSGIVYSDFYQYEAV